MLKKKKRLPKPSSGGMGGPKGGGGPTPPSGGGKPPSAGTGKGGKPPSAGTGKGGGKGGGGGGPPPSGGGGASPAPRARKKARPMPKLNWFESLARRFPNALPLAGVGGASTLAYLLSGGNSSPALAKRPSVGVDPTIIPDDEGQGDAGSEPTIPIAPSGTQIPKNPQGQERGQAMTTAQDRAKGNVPWGTLVKGVYVSPDFDSDTRHMRGLDGGFNEIAENQAISFNDIGMPTAVQHRRDINAQLADPNSPMQAALKRMAAQVSTQAGRPQAPQAPQAPDEDVSRPMGYAKGGYISKRDGVPVNAGRDNRMIAAQDGEFVLSRRAVQMLGLRNLEQLNRMAAGPDANEPTDNNGIMGYADGGEVRMSPQGAPMMNFEDPEFGTNFDSSMRTRTVQSWEESPKAMAGMTGMQVIPAMDDVARAAKAKNLYEVLKGTQDISGNAEATRILQNPSKKVPNAGFTEKVATKTANALGANAKTVSGVAKNARIAGALGTKATIGASIWDTIAAPVAELTGADYSIDNMVSQKIAKNDEEERFAKWKSENPTAPESDYESELPPYHSNVQGVSPKFVRSMAIAGTNDPSKLTAFDKARGAGEAMLNEAMLGGFDSMRGSDWSLPREVPLIGGMQMNPYYNKDYARTRGAETDPFGVGALVEKLFTKNAPAANIPQAWKDNAARSTTPRTKRRRS